MKADEADLEPSTLNLAPFLTVHVPPQPDHAYVIGADPAEGNPQSDESAAVVLDLANGEQVATLGLRCDPEMFAVHLNRLAKAYGSVTHTRHGSFPCDAGILVERNNHGHAVLLVLRQLGAYLLHGLDREPGWATTGASKSMLFDLAAKDIREGGLRLHDETTYWQLTAIDGATLAAPPGQHDDRAIACVLALAALRSCRPGLVSVPAIPPVDVIKRHEPRGDSGEEAGDRGQGTGVRGQGTGDRGTGGRGQETGVRRQRTGGGAPPEAPQAAPLGAAQGGAPVRSPGRTAGGRAGPIFGKISRKPLDSGAGRRENGKQAAGLTLRF